MISISGEIPRSTRRSRSQTDKKLSALAKRRRSNADGFTARRRAAETADPDAPRPKPAHWRYLRAFLDLLDEGGAVTQTALAKRLGRSRQTLWKMHLRHPWLAAWVSGQIERHTGELIGPVIRKMGAVGLRGSVDHAKLFLQAQGRLQEQRSVTQAVQVQVLGLPARASLDEWRALTGASSV